MEEQEIIKLWKDLNIDRLVFSFSCGGDEMDSSNIEIHDKDENIIENSEINNYFEEKIFDNVQFYEVSDGHYMGESGTVEIRLIEEDSEDPFFSYDKESEGEWLENNKTTITFNLTEDEAKFVSEHIENMNGDGWNRETMYKSDFNPSEEDKRLVEGIHAKITEFAENYVPEEYEGDLNGQFEYNTNDMEEGEELIIVGQELTLRMKTKSYAYRPQY